MNILNIDIMARNIVKKRYNEKGKTDMAIRHMDKMNMDMNMNIMEKEIMKMETMDLDTMI